MTVADVEEKVQKKVMKRLEEMEGVVFLDMLTRGEKVEVTLLRTERVTLYMGGLVRKLLTKINVRGGGLDETERFRMGRGSEKALVELVRRELEKGRECSLPIKN